MTYLMFHKPAGCVTARRDDSHKTVMDCLPDRYRHLFPMGRLDRDTEGLLLLTDDGAFNYRLMQPEYHVAKTYFFCVFGHLDEDKITLLSAPTVLPGSGRDIARPAEILCREKTDVRHIALLLPEDRRAHYLKHPEGKASTGLIRITEGKRHEVKRLMKAVGCTVGYLKRLSIGALQLDEALAPGDCRELTEEDFRLLFAPPLPLTDYPAGTSKQKSQDTERSDIQ